MQAVRFRVLLALFRFGLAVEKHDQFESRFLSETLDYHNYSSFYLEVQKFERSATLVHDAGILSPVETELMQLVADNVSHNVRSIDEFNTFHGMGIIGSFTSGEVKANQFQGFRFFQKIFQKIDSQYTNKPPVTFKELNAKKVIESCRHPFTNFTSVQTSMARLYAVSA